MSSNILQYKDHVISPHSTLGFWYVSNPKTNAEIAVVGSIADAIILIDKVRGTEVVVTVSEKKSDIKIEQTQVEAAKEENK